MLYLCLDLLLFLTGDDPLATLRRIAAYDPFPTLPRVAHLRRFPSREIGMTQYNLYIEHLRYLRHVRPYYPEQRREIDAAIEASEFNFKLWDLLTNAQGQDFTETKEPTRRYLDAYEFLLERRFGREVGKRLFQQGWTPTVIKNYWCPPIIERMPGAEE